MERITILTITEKERLALRDDVSRTFRATGDHLLYLMPPCIVLGGASEIRRRITVPERLTLTGDTGENAWGSFRCFLEDGALQSVQRELGLPEIPTGLHISALGSDRTLLTDVGSVRCYSLAEALTDGSTFRIIRQKRL